MLGCWDRPKGFGLPPGRPAAKTATDRARSSTVNELGIGGGIAGTRLTGSDRAWECRGLDITSTGRRREGGFDEGAVERVGRTIDR